MAWTSFKIFFMVILSAIAFMASPMGFPFVLVTVFSIWATPYALAAYFADDDAKA